MFLLVCIPLARPVLYSDLSIDSFRMLLDTLSSIIGAIVLISILLPWFLLVVAVVSVLYAMASAFYRASAREMKVRSPANMIQEFFLKAPAATRRYPAVVFILPFL